MNKHKGELAITIGEKTYTARLSSNSLCSLETVTGQDSIPLVIGFLTALSKGKGLSISHMRAILWAMLREHHSELSLQDAGNLIDEAGVKYIGKCISDIVPLTWPKADEGSSHPPGS